MLRNHDLAGLRLELAAELAAPGTIFKGLVRPCRFLNGRDVPPTLVVARAVPAMHGVEDSELGLPRCIQHLHHIRNAVISFGDPFDSIPYLASF